ncbi:MAG: VCBS repeat-containing protein, partial [Candidatus Hinthialibacter sp.]
TISAGDWDGDGDPDIISGNSYGEVILFRNQQENGASISRARFTRPEPLYAGDAPIRITAGANGSIQGPNEAHYGYTCPVLCDWNGDGRMDLILSDIWGMHTYYQRAAGKDANPDRLLPGVPILCQSPGKDAFVPPWIWHKPRNHELITQWRCQPAAVDWNRDGVLDLITLDSRGYLALYPGVQDAPQPEVGPPRRCFASPDGAPIRITNGQAEIIPERCIA